MEHLFIVLLIMPLNRRDFLGALALISMQQGKGMAENIEQAKRMQTGASVQLRQRLIWNDDGDDIRAIAFGLKRLWNARDRNTAPVTDRFLSVQEFLDLRLSGIKDTPVDTISYCGVFTWPVWEMPRERIAVLGVDPILPVIDFVHACGKEFFFNLRMNDCHSAGPYWQGPSNWEPFRQNNLHLLQSTLSEDEIQKDYLPWIKGDSPNYPLQSVLNRRGSENRDVQSWSAFDYSKNEVRNYFLGLILEACNRYDLDGVDLDWLRMPFYFRFGQERRGVALMNDFVRRVAEAVREAARVRGRPIALAMRVPDTLERALEIGLDVRTWLAEGWLDLLVVGNGLTPSSLSLAQWRRAAAVRGIPVYGCISRSAPNHADAKVFRGACHKAWREGSDGLYFFNHFIQEEYSTMADVADPKRLLQMSKTYGVDQSFTGTQNGTIASGPLPVVFTSFMGTCSMVLSIEILENPAEAKSVRIITRWLGSDADARTEWRINGELTHVIQRDLANVFIYDGSLVRAGRNYLQVTVFSASSIAESELVLETVLVTIERA